MADTHKKLDPLDELSEESLKKIRNVTDAIHKATDNIDINLATDPIKVPGQNWACVSFVSPSGNQKCDFFGFKIRGVFDRRDEANDYVKRLIKLDPSFDIFVCDMYNWCLAPPDPEKITDQTYQDETLNSIISEYKKNQIYAKEHFEERKRELVQQAADEARRAALKRIEEESESLKLDAENEYKNSDFIKASQSNDNRIIDVTEIDPPGEGVTASEIFKDLL
jgi:hypothetical protein